MTALHFEAFKCSWQHLATCLHVCCSIQLKTGCSGGKKKKKSIYFVFASDAAKPLETHTQKFSCKCFNRKNFFPPLCSREPGGSALCFAVKRRLEHFFLLLLSFTCRWHHAASFRQVVTSFLFSARSSLLLRMSPDRNVCGRFCWSCLLLRKRPLGAKVSFFFFISAITGDAALLHQRVSHGSCPIPWYPRGDKESIIYNHLAAAHQ